MTYSTNIQGETPAASLIWETIYGQIVAKANNYVAVPDKSTGGRRMIKSDKVRNYERDFLRQCRLYKGKMIARPFALNVCVYYRHGNFDLDNSLKTLLDCLQYAGAIANDNLCERIVAVKRIDKSRPRVTFAIVEQPEPPRLFPA